MTKAAMIEKINSIPLDQLTAAVYCIMKRNPINAINSNGAWTRTFNGKIVKIRFSSRALKSSIEAVYYAILDEIIIRHGLEAIRNIDSEYTPAWCKPENTKTEKEGKTMESYNYKEAVLKDVREYIDDEIYLENWKGNRDGLEEKLNDTLWTADSVTGNASGSYTFNTWQAEENICHNLDLLKEALDELGSGKDYLLTNGAEAADVTIRCYLLGEAIAEVLDELENEGAFDEAEEGDGE